MTLLVGHRSLGAELAQDKAYTVAVHGMASHRWWDLIQHDSSLVHGINMIDRLIIFGGGVPVVHDGKMIGAIAVSGKSTSEQYQQIAQVAGEAVTEHLTARAI